MKFDNVVSVRISKTIYRDGDSIVKVFDKDYKKSDVLSEALNQSRVEESEFSVPKVLEVKKIDDKWAIVMEHVDGKTLQQLMNENPDKIDQYLEKFIDLQLEMHAKSVPLLTKLRDKMDRKIDETNLDETIKYELHHRLNGMPKHAKLCHGDFNPSNIIVAQDGKAFIIDWAHATQGNASADAARTYLLFRLTNTEKIAEKYINMFCQKSDTARLYVDRWLPIVAASQSVKGKPEERDFLLSWVNVVEFE